MDTASMERTDSASSAVRTVAFVYGAVCYVLFLGTLLYAAGFICGWFVPRTIDSGKSDPIQRALLVNILLLSVFAVQHSVMPRPWFKARWTRIVPKPIERSTYVLFTCLILGTLFWQWRTIPRVIWQVDQAFFWWVLTILSACGWLLVLYSSFLIDHFELFGLRQVYEFARNRSIAKPTFVTPTLYRWVRNPLMLGFLIAFWAAPVMTAGHLLFAIVTTGYIFVGIVLEERDNMTMLGDEYRSYRARTPMILPQPPKY